MHWNLYAEVLPSICHSQYRFFERTNNLVAEFARGFVSTESYVALICSRMLENMLTVNSLYLRKGSDGAKVRLLLVGVSAILISFPNYGPLTLAVQGEIQSDLLYSLDQCFSTFFASRTTLCNKKILGNTKQNFIITIMMFSSVLALLIH